MSMITDRKTVYATPWFELVAKTMANDGRPPSDHFCIQTSDYVNVLALTAEGKVLLVRQYRPAVEQATLELPAGHVDAGETPEAGARRELEEETGYRAGKMELLAKLMPDTGRLANRVWCFFTSDVVRVGAPQVEDEQVELHECTQAELARYVEENALPQAMHLTTILLAAARGKLNLGQAGGMDRAATKASVSTPPVAPPPPASPPASPPTAAKTTAHARITRTPGGRPDVCIIGGAGTMGLPLSLVLASKGMRVLIHDRNEKVMATIRSGTMPFIEHGAQPLLDQALASGMLEFSPNPADLRDAPALIVTIGTPVDEFLNPNMRVMRRWLDEVLPYLRDSQLIILRSTVYPGTTEWLDRQLREAGIKALVSFCPERIVQGYAVSELPRLTQIVSGTTPEAEEAAAAFWGQVAPEVVRLSPMEAEFAKLFCNAYRYIQFAAANQFYMVTTSAGVDYYRVLEGLKQNYPRMRDLPRAGFAAGPCLLKDTMQLAAFSQNQFALGNAAMLVNEGMILFLVAEMQKRFVLENMTVGLLGMAFKADSDDPRSSLSYKLKKVLSFRARRVLTTDPHVSPVVDVDLLPLEEVIDESDVLVLCTPHSAYRGMDTQGKEVIDVWGFSERKSG